MNPWKDKKKKQCPDCKKYFINLGAHTKHIHPSGDEF